MRERQYFKNRIKPKESHWNVILPVDLLMIEGLVTNQSLIPYPQILLIFASSFPSIMIVSLAIGGYINELPIMKEMKGLIIAAIVVSLIIYGIYYPIQNFFQEEIILHETK